MNYKDISTFQQRMKDSKPTNAADAMCVLHEEIAELRHYIEWYLTPERNFCTRCGKRSHQDTVHTCTPPQVFDYVNNTAP